MTSVTITGQPIGLRLRFEKDLHAAITTGKEATSASGIGPATAAALKVVAQAHPEATAHDIATAYDTFAREHSRCGSALVPRPTATTPAQQSLP